MLMKRIENTHLFVREDGLIWSSFKRNFLQTNSLRGGYKYVSIYPKGTKGKLVKTCVHVLVAETFLGKRPPNLVCNHKDGNKTNNKVENLEWVTVKENNDHAHRIGLWKTKTKQHPSRGLRDSQAKKLREFHNEGNLNYRELGELFGIHRDTVWRYVRVHKVD